MNITTFRAFRSRNYRLYFTGQSVSLIGTWMQKTAVYWLIYIQTHSTFMLGVAVFAAQFPSFLFSLLGGVISDRYDRYRVLLLTQVLSMVQAILMTLLVLFNAYTVWEILSLSVVLGIINAFDVPARQSLVYDMVDHKEDLSNAIALNSSMVNLARLIGPAISGIVLETLGAGMCFMINAASFAAVLISLLLMHLPKHLPHIDNKKVLLELKEGFSYLKQTPSIGYIVLFVACSSLFVLPFTTLFPVYAKVIFAGNASTFGYLNSFIGLGAICGTFFLASLKPGTDLKNILFINTLIFGIGLILFSHMTNLPLALGFAVITGFGMMSQTTVSNTIIQTTVSPEMRGRVISYFAMAFFGMLPLGGLLIGSVSHYLGTPNTLLAEGIAALIITSLFSHFLRKDVIKRKEHPGGMVADGHETS
ncbi:MAG TPA: MFS transporter [Bacteroidia bacterium]|jgi:MFS family permease|nr:MFS transporter [Bacteroidia bacterium]